MKTSVEWSIEINRSLDINGVAEDPELWYQSKSEAKGF